MRHQAAFSSKTVEWETPQELFDQWDAVYDFTLDVASTPENAKVAKFYTVDDDGLNQPWSGHTVWCNPPYGRQIGKWVEKAYRESRDHRAIVVMLIPAKTETRWWHDYVTQADEIHFVKGRIQFGNSGANAPFPSCVVVFGSWPFKEPSRMRIVWGMQP